MPVFSNNGGGGGGGGVPPSGLLEYYVDAATGSDAADGLTWATAWLTCQGALRNLARFYELYPTALETRVFMRGTFGPNDPLVAPTLPQFGKSSLYFGCRLADSTVVAGPGIVTNVGEVGPPPYPACSLMRVDLGGGLVLNQSHEGKLIVFSAGARVATYQIAHVDNAGGNNFVRLTIPTSVGLPAWIIPNVVVQIIDSGLTIQGGVLLNGDFTPYGTGLINARANDITVRGGHNIFMASEAVGKLFFQSCPHPSRVAPDGISNIGNFLNALGLCTPPLPGEPIPVIGSKADLLLCNEIASVAGDTDDDLLPEISGYFNEGRLLGGTVQIRGAAFSRLTTFGFAFVHNVILGEMASGTEPVLGVISGTVFGEDISVFGPAPTGIDNGLFAVARNGLLSLRHTWGCNGGGGGPGTYLGAVAYEGSLLCIEDAYTAANLLGDSGRFWTAGGKIRFGEDVIFGASVGGIDLLALDGRLVFEGSVIKTAVNGGAAAGPLLLGFNNSDIMQNGNAFTLPAGTGDYVTDYGPFGAIHLDKNTKGTVGDLSGGTPLTTSVGCNIRHGSSLVHQGPGLSGVAPIVIGADGLPGGRPWPLASQSDSLYNSNELCLCSPPFTGGGAPPPTAYTFNAVAGVAIGDAVYLTGAPNTVDKAFMGAVGQTTEAIGIVVALPGPGLCNVVLNGEAAAYPPATLTPGALYYVSNLVPGGITTAAPVAQGEKQQRIGFAATDQILVVETDLTSVKL